MRRTNDAEEILNEIWEEIGFDPPLAILVVRGLVQACIESCQERDREMISKIFVFDATHRQPLERAN